MVGRFEDDMHKQISQREARALKRRVEQLVATLKKERHRYAREWPGGTHIGTFETVGADNRYAAVHTARGLGHAVVVTSDGYNRFNLYAIPHPEIPA